MTRKIRCAVCGLLACVCFAGSALADNRDAIKQLNDFTKHAANVLTPVSSSAGLADQSFLYVTNTMGGPDLKAVRENKVKTVQYSGDLHFHVREALEAIRHELAKKK